MPSATSPPFSAPGTYPTAYRQTEPITACPSASVPVGFTEAGLPVGLQILGPPRGEAAVLRAAAAIEEAIPLSARTPIDPLGADGATLAAA